MFQSKSSQPSVAGPLRNSLNQIITSATPTKEHNLPVSMVGLEQLYPIRIACCCGAHDTQGVACRAHKDAI